MLAISVAIRDLMVTNIDGCSSMYQSRIITVNASELLRYIPLTLLFLVFAILLNCHVC